MLRLQPIVHHSCRINYATHKARAGVHLDQRLIHARAMDEARGDGADNIAANLVFEVDMIAYRAESDLRRSTRNFDGL